MSSKAFWKNTQHPTRETNVGYQWERLFKPGVRHTTVGYRKKRTSEQSLQKASSKKA